MIVPPLEVLLDEICTGSVMLVGTEKTDVEGWKMRKVFLCMHNTGNISVAVILTPCFSSNTLNQCGQDLLHIFTVMR